MNTAQIKSAPGLAVRLSKNPQMAEIQIKALKIELAQPELDEKSRVIFLETLKVFEEEREGRCNSGRH